MKNRATSLISRLRDFLSCLAPLKSLEHTLVALEHLPSALCLLTCSQKSTLKFSAPFPLAAFPRSKKKLSKTHTPKLSIYFFVPCGSPATFFICLGCYSNGFCQALTPTLAHRVWQSYFAHWGTSQDVTTFSASDTSNKFLPAPPQDCECQINLILQLFCSNHLRVTLTSNSTSLWVHCHASQLTAHRGRCRFAGRVLSCWERLAHQFHTDNHVTCRPRSQIPSITLVQIHAAPWGCISVRERKMRL